jgi:alanine racemase
VTAPLRLRLDSAALVQNWRTLDRMSGTAACGAAVKANGYGLGAYEVAKRLADAGCRDFFVATWAEAQVLAPLGLQVSVLHGVRAEDMPAAMAGFARPVLNTELQIARWKDAGGGPCDVMVDTGMNRLGISPGQVADGLAHGLRIETLMSHLACADEDVPMNEAQRVRFVALEGKTSARRMSIANSAGIGLGSGYRFDLTRPGLALYGGIPSPPMAGSIRQVATPEAQILQRRLLYAGETVGYNATWVAQRTTEIAIVNLGYADGYGRGFSDHGTARLGKGIAPVIGRVSMDLVALDVSREPSLHEGDWIIVDFDLPAASRASGLSQYELLTRLGCRLERNW